MIYIMVVSVTLSAAAGLLLIKKLWP